MKRMRKRYRIAHHYSSDSQLFITISPALHQKAGGPPNSGLTSNEASTNTTQVRCLFSPLLIFLYPFGQTRVFWFRREEKKQDYLKTVSYTHLTLPTTSRV